MSEDESAATEYVDHLQQIQSVLADLDPSAMCTGFVAVVEWIEEDGSPSLSLIHSPMQPWHLQGMLGHATKYHDMPVIMLSDQDGDADWDDE